MPHLAFFACLLAVNAEGSGEDRPPTAIFFFRFTFESFALIRLTKAISPYRRYAKPSDGSTKDPKTITSRLTREKSNAL